MNKKLIAVFLILGVAVFVARYGYIRTYGIHLSAARFIEKAGDGDGAGSMHSLRYDGVRDGRAYLHSWEMDRAPESITYWAEIDAFPVHTKNQMLSKTGRWKVAGQKIHLEEQAKQKQFDDPADGYFRAYLLLEEAGKATDRKESIRLLQEAVASFQAVKSRFPDWKTSMVDGRIQQTQELLARRATADR